MSLKCFLFIYLIGLNSYLFLFFFGYKIQHQRVVQLNLFEAVGIESLFILLGSRYIIDEKQFIINAIKYDFSYIMSIIQIIPISAVNWLYYIEQTFNSALYDPSYSVIYNTIVYFRNVLGSLIFIFIDFLQARERPQNTPQIKQ